MAVDFQVNELHFGYVREITSHSVTILADKLEVS